MADIIEPNKALAELRIKLSQAKTVAERTKIAEQITAFEATLDPAVIEASKGGLSPAVQTPESFKGKTVLSPSMTEGIYRAYRYDPVTGARVDLSQTDTGVTQFGAQGTNKKVVYYDAKGNPISAADLAQTQEGKKQAAAGADIGYGPGKIGPGATDYAPGYKSPGTTSYNRMMGLDPLTGQPIEEVLAGRAKYTDPQTGRVITTDASGKVVFADTGLPYTGSTTATGDKAAAGQSAYSLLLEQFNQYGLGALIEPLKKFIVEGLSPAEFTLRLRDTDAYKKRFAANQARIKSGLRALSEAEYIGLEDQYQDVMRRYGLPESYYTRGDMGRQEGFEKFIGGDVSPVELEDRIQTAQTRVVNANPEVSKALREFYPEITGGDILAYALDPAQAINNIKRKVGAAEIGAGAMQAGLKTGLARAEELQRYGVTKETARQGFGTISSGLERGRQLSNIYQQPTYTQEVAETEVFALPDAEKARRQRRRLGQLETATFSGTTGMTGGALDRERAGQY